MIVNLGSQSELTYQRNKSFLYYAEVKQIDSLKCSQYSINFHLSSKMRCFSAILALHRKVSYIYSRYTF